MWRLKWKPQSGASASDSNGEQPLYLGAASMHNGSNIQRIDSNACTDDGALIMTTVETQIDCNEARLVYGMDWLQEDATKPMGTQTVFENVEALENSSEIHQLEYEIATCSFYDNLVQIWSS